MAIIGLTVADAEIAAATFKDHLDQLWQSDRVKRLKWERRDLDPLHTLVTLPGKRATGEVEPYFVRLGAEYYDLGPPMVHFVQPDGQTITGAGTRFFPGFSAVPPWFTLHSAYPHPGRGPGQLVCFSFSAEYYLTDHSPKESERWQQGTHTVAATLNRLAEILSPPFYRSPSGP